jgi:hypothetical protein
MSTKHLPFFFSQFLSAPCVISVIREIESSSGTQRCQHDICPSFSLNPSLPVCLSVCLSFSHIISMEAHPLRMRFLFGDLEAGKEATVFVDITN